MPLLQPLSPRALQACPAPLSWNQWQHVLHSIAEACHLSGVDYSTATWRQAMLLRFGANWKQLPHVTEPLGQLPATLLAEVLAEHQRVTPIPPRETALAKLLPCPIDWLLGCLMSLCSYLPPSCRNIPPHPPH